MCVGRPAQALKHNPGLSVDWSPEEQAILEEELDNTENPKPKGHRLECNKERRLLFLPSLPECRRNKLLLLLILYSAARLSDAASCIEGRNFLFFNLLLIGCEGAAGYSNVLLHSFAAEVQKGVEETHASESSIIRYAKIAMSLPNKTVRDVALRCRWMTKKESGKRRKEDHNLSKKSKDKKERVTDALAKPSTHLGSLPNAPLYPLPMLPMDDDDITYKVIGGRTGQLLQSNSDAFTKISANLASLKVQDNISLLLCQTRDNILTILADLNDMPEIMKQMPPLPVKMNEELANSILPRTTVPMQS
ncbi:hypothetical protein C4D60_Mb03t20250 [Musa balbisiana]|uniref:Uncharacterized protein n=1 Tax=Musa balbisiana TaxID=52838 RepID=A0A4S8JB72_MUSBA|nr:hypothetical protein C4D60_Mb03t20250 [Musa balbisiana]